MYVRYVKTNFHGQKTFRLVGGSLSWSERLIFIRGALTNGAKVASERWNVRKLFFCSNSYISRSSGKKEKAWRFICPYLSKGPKYAGSYRFNIEMKRKLSQWQWKWKQKLKASSTAWYGGSWKWKVHPFASYLGNSCGKVRAHCTRNRLSTD